MEQVNPLRRTVLLSWILFNINIFFMASYGYALFDEILLIYANNIMQLTAIALLVCNVFNELLVICKIKMWVIKPKP